MIRKESQKSKLRKMSGEFFEDGLKNTVAIGLTKDTMNVQSNS